MKCAVVAVLLAVVQAAPPVPRKAPDSSAGASNKIQRQSKAKDQATSQSSPPTEPKPSPDHEATGEGHGQHDREHSVAVTKLPPVTIASPKRDWADWGTWVFNAFLLVVGALQVVLLCWTYRLITHQARETTRQRVWMGRQWETMQGQLNQMIASGVQTDALITQATIQAEKTGIAAEAAKVSADAFVLSERAWIQVTVSKPPLIHLNHNRVVQRAWVVPDVMNVGRTPAKITKIVVVPIVIPEPLKPSTDMPPELPAEPIYSGTGSRSMERDAILAPHNGINPIMAEIEGLPFADAANRRNTLYVFGYVDYSDVGGKPHQTRFCHLWWPHIADDPNPECFMVAGNTPAAYTHCT